MERGGGLQQIGLLGRVERRAHDGAHRGFRQLWIGRRPERGVERDDGEPAGRIARGRRVFDRAPEVHHRREPVVRTAARGIVQDAPLRPQHALERAPRELAQRREIAELPEAGPYFLDGLDDGVARPVAIDLHLGLRTHLTVARVEREQSQRAPPLVGRLEGPREDQSHVGGGAPLPSEIAPRLRGDERFHGAGGGVGLVGSLSEELRQRDVLAANPRETVHQGCQAEPETAPIAGHAEGDHHRGRLALRVRHRWEHVSCDEAAR